MTRPCKRETIRQARIWMRARAVRIIITSFFTLALIVYHMNRPNLIDRPNLYFDTVRGPSPWIHWSMNRNLYNMFTFKYPDCSEPYYRLAELYISEGHEDWDAARYLLTIALKRDRWRNTGFLMYLHDVFLLIFYGDG